VLDNIRFETTFNPTLIFVTVQWDREVVLMKEIRYNAPGVLPPREGSTLQPPAIKRSGSSLCTQSKLELWTVTELLCMKHIVAAV
jgi:hypothetical protein